MSEPYDRKGTVPEDLTLTDAMRYVEGRLPLKKGWSSFWQSSRVEGGMGVKKPFVHYLYMVQNSKGRTVLTVNVTPKEQM